jgi:hypothetical protein
LVRRVGLAKTKLWHVSEGTGVRTQPCWAMIAVMMMIMNGGGGSGDNDDVERHM